MRCELYVRFGDSDDPVGGVIENSQHVKELYFIDKYDDLNFDAGNFLRSIEKLGGEPSEVAIDLLVVATAVFLADTSFSRGYYSSDGWTRQFLLHIPVSDEKTWQGYARQLSGMLKFLTGDFWIFDFRTRPDEYETLREAPVESNLTVFDHVSLLSGGLDSLIGAIDQLSQGYKSLFISHHWDGETSSAQVALIERLVEKFGEDSFENLRGRIGATYVNLVGAGSENSQRARSFLFYSMAALAADAFENTDQVFIPENGLIALNVPLDRVRLGSLSTRTSHPHFIAAMNRLVKSLGVAANFSNFYRFKTKGEMVSECTDRDFLTEIVNLSMSCSSPAKVRWQGAAPQLCGYCYPCLIRRGSLKAGLLVDDQTNYYLSDLTANELDSKSATGRDIRSSLFAYKIIEKEPHRARFLVRKPGPLPANEIDDYAGVYSRGMAEVATQLKKVRVRHA